MDLREFITKVKNLFTRLPFALPIMLGILFFIQPIPFLKPIGFFIFFFTFAFSPKRRRRRERFYSNAEDAQFEILKKSEDEYKKAKDYLEDVKANDELFEKIKNYLNKKKLSAELAGFEEKLEAEISNSKKTVDKIAVIDEALKNMNWDIERIDQKIQEEKNSGNDGKRLNKLYETRQNILQLKERKEKLINQITDISLSFQAIYTKLTLLDLEQHPAFDEIETEIQKILDRKLRVSQYQEKLDKEMKNYSE